LIESEHELLVHLELEMCVPAAPRIASFQPRPAF
jgi:hypothetical protein